MRASEAAGVHRSSHFHWVKSDETYAEAFRQAEGMAGLVLEAEARRRAAEGINKPIYYQGQRVDAIKEYSDTLLIFLLKGALPHKYREGWDFEQRLAALEARLKREGKP
jgi:hypothetical protein